jgi:transposase-like protein
MPACPWPADTWHLAEVFLTINGQTYYLWRAVDQEGHVLDVLVQSRGNAAAAKRLMRKLMKKMQCVPRVLITDTLHNVVERHVIGVRLRVDQPAALHSGVASLLCAPLPHRGRRA